MSMWNGQINTQMAVHNLTLLHATARSVENLYCASSIPHK